MADPEHPTSSLVTRAYEGTLCWGNLQKSRAEIEAELMLEGSPVADVIRRIRAGGVAYPAPGADDQAACQVVRDLVDAWSVKQDVTAFSSTLGDRGFPWDGYDKPGFLSGQEGDSPDGGGSGYDLSGLECLAEPVASVSAPVYPTIQGITRNPDGTVTSAWKDLSGQVDTSNLEFWVMDASFRSVVDLEGAKPGLDHVTIPSGILQPGATYRVGVNYEAAGYTHFHAWKQFTL